MRWLEDDLGSDQVVGGRKVHRRAQVGGRYGVVAAKQTIRKGTAFGFRQSFGVKLDGNTAVPGATVLLY